MFAGTFVMSQKEAESYCRNCHTNESIIISICNSFDMDARLFKTKQNKIIDILKLSFDDVFKSELTKDPLVPHLWIDRMGRAVNPINTSDCQKIHDFIMKYYKSDKTVDLIVNCEMGISRSSAVMAAILKALYDDDTQIYSNNKYRPNPDVYRAVLDYFMEKSAEDSVTVSNVDNLRFGIKHTPCHYNPIIDYVISEDKKIALYTPFIELCEIIPELKGVTESLEYYSLPMPFYYFNFASIIKISEKNKFQFESFMEIDRGKEPTSSHENTVAYSIIEAYKVRPLPGVNIVQKKKEIDGVECEVINYFITLGNINSLYFYEKGFPYNIENKDRLEDIVLEIEYTYPEGYKTWCYISLIDVPDIWEETNNDLDYNSSNQMNTVLRYVTEFMDQFIVAPLNKITSKCKTVLDYSNFWIDTTEKEQKIKIIAQNLKGEAIEISYNWNEWINSSRSMTNVRLVNFNIKKGE